MERRIGKLSSFAVLLALAVLVINAWLSYRNTIQAIDREKSVQHTDEVLADIEAIQAKLSDAVAAQRGFLLSSDANFLGPFQSAQHDIEIFLNQLRELTRDNQKQTPRVDLLKDLAGQEFESLRDAIALRRGGTLVLANHPEVLQDSKHVMDRFRETISQMRGEEESLLRDRQNDSKMSIAKALGTFSVATVVAVGMVAIAFYLIRRDAVVRRNAALEQSRLANYNRLLVESTGDGIYGVDLAGNCTFLNAAGSKILKIKPDEVLGKNMHAVFHHTRPDGSPYPVADCPIYRTARTGKGCRIDSEVFWRKDGSSFPVDYSAYPIRDGEEVEGVVVAFTDVTLRKKIEEELRDAKVEADKAKTDAEAANIAKSQFLANMSHELRTPLNAVIMYSELLQEEAVDRGVDSFIPDLDKIRNGGKHLLALVNGVLDLSKIEAGKMDLYLETFDVSGMVHDVVTTVEPLLMKRDNKLELKTADDLSTMHADLTKVRQILFNLLSNASKFTEKGAVSLSVTREMMDGIDSIIFRVADTGIGMTAEQISRLFQPFTQADASTTRRFGGTGLGLAISRRFCQLMGGDVNVESVEGKGSTFTVHLPARVSKPAPLEVIPPSAGTTGKPAVGAATVLIIDDEPAVRDLMSRSLASEGIYPVTASDGEEGLRKARELKPDLIFLDVMMPKMDGWAVLTAIKSDKELADIPVVMLTIVSNQEMGFVLGASEYLTKPIDRDRLAVVVDKYRVKDTQGVVLVVDDDDATRQVLRRTLTRQGWTVLEAENGKVALEHVEKHSPALILLDLSMPEMDGFEFLTRLRKDQVNKDIPVVVLTSKDLTAEERSTLTGNVERILQKGQYSKDAMLREVKVLVSMCAKKFKNGTPKQIADCAAETAKNESAPVVADGVKE